jgi:hypothetical protein
VRQLPVHIEPLNLSEQQFVMRRARHEGKELYKVGRVLMVMCFIIPFLLAWLWALDGAADPFSPKRYFLGVGLLATLSGGGVFLAYRRVLYPLLADLRQGTKTVERAHLTRKVYMLQNNTHHFYLDSPTRLSIEASPEDYSRLDEGDEVNIEYTTCSKIYLGYY